MSEDGQADQDYWNDKEWLVWDDDEPDDEEEDETDV